MGGEPTYRGRAGNSRSRPETGHSALRGIASSPPFADLQIEAVNGRIREERSFAGTDQIEPLNSLVRESSSPPRRSIAQRSSAGWAGFCAKVPAAGGAQRARPGSSRRSGSPTSSAIAGSPARTRTGRSRVCAACAAISSTPPPPPITAASSSAPATAASSSSAAWSTRCAAPSKCRRHGRA
jgi:hypothetical protein